MSQQRPLLVAVFGAFLFPLLAIPCTAQTPLGTYTDHDVGPSSVTIWADTSGVRITPYRADVIRVDLLPSRSTTHDSSLVVVRNPESSSSFDVSETEETLTISTTALTVQVRKDPVRLRVQDSGGDVLLQEPRAAGFVAEGETRRAQFTLPSDVRFYGTGERGLNINLRGEHFRSYNQSVFGYDQPEPTMNINVPLLLTSEKYALLFDDPYPGTFDLGARDPSKFWYEADGGELSCYVLAGESIPEQLEAYTWLTGRPPMPPKWALGYLQSKYGYRSAEAARQTVSRLREEDIPTDGLILDLYWFEHMGDLSWDRNAFPNPSQMIEDLETKGVKTIVITEPYLTEPSTGFSAMEANGPPRAAETEAGTPYRIPGWWTCECDALLADLTHSPTRSWWKDQYTNILNSGVHGLWTDLGEPEVHPSDMQHDAGPADAVHNEYNLLWARTVHEAFSQNRPNRRLVNLTRSGYAGIQRYGVFTWSADVARTFDGLAVQRPIMLNSSLSGLYYHSSDLGGFVGQTSPELYARWMQMGAFTPVARAHGIDNQPTEPWGFAPSGLAISRKYLKLRYRLLPYLYTMAYRAYDQGMPIVRPLFFENPDASRLASEDGAYLFGDSFLVAPVVEAGKRQKTVPLPPGSWINYWTDEAYPGGTTVTVDAPLDRLPLFVREGAIVPMRPSAPDYVGTSVADTLRLAVYPSDDGNQFTLYEDDGLTRSYQRGAFAETTFQHRPTTVNDRPALEVTLGPAQGSFDGQPERRTYQVAIHRIFQPPRQVRLDGHELRNRGSVSTLHQRSNGYAYDPVARRLHIQVETDTRSERQLQIRGVQPAGVDAENVDEYELEAPAPHPVRDHTSISFRLPKRGHVTLRMYDVLGRRVATLVDEIRQKGPYAVPFSPDAAGLSSGVYFYRLTVTGTVDGGDPNRTRFDKTRKMTVIR